MDEVKQAMKENPVLSRIIRKIENQQEKGLRKYGEFVTLSSYSDIGWLEHLQQELIDALVYSECAIQKIREAPNEKGYQG